jgi:hypothetical protein
MARIEIRRPTRVAASRLKKPGLPGLITWG